MRALLPAAFAVAMLWSLPSMALTQSEDSSAPPAGNGEGAGPPRGFAPGLTDWDGDHISDYLQAKLAGLGSGEQLDVVVTLSGTGTAASVQQAVGGFAVHHVFDIISGFSATMSAGQVRALARHSNIFRIEADFEITTQLNYATRDFGITPNPLVDPATEPTAMGARQDFGVTGAGVKVCVVDTGIDEGHERHSGKVDGWVDFVSAIPSPNLATDDNGHGTHVASIVGGQVVDWQGSGSPNPDPNGDPFEGVAPDARLYVAKVLDAAGSGTNSAVVAGINWCVAQAADIINLSLGGDTCGDGLSAVSLAADAAVANGVTVIVAAGNSGDGICTVTAPGDAFDVITVGSLAEYSGAPSDVNSSTGVHTAWFSSRGPTGDNRPKPDVMAPGVSVMAAKAGTVSDYQSLSGTSMATPFIAGVAALMLEANPSLTPADIKDILACTAQDYHVLGPDNEVGAGAVDGYAAVQMAEIWSGTCGVMDAINLPNFVHLSDSVADSSEWIYSFEITEADLGSPIAATVTILNQVFVCEVFDPFGSGECWAGYASPDLDAELHYVRGDGALVKVDEGTCMSDVDGKCGAAGRTETLNFRPTAQTALGVGTYEIQVHGANDTVNLGAGGDFVLDLSYGLWPGAVNGNGGGGTPPPAPNQPPTAGFTVSTNDLTASFTDASSDSDGGIASRSWDFGDGGTSSATNPSHTYASAGTYTVRLTVTDDDGATGSASQTVTVTVTAPPTETTVVKLTASDGWDEKNEKTLVADGKLYVVQNSDDDRWETLSEYITSFEFGGDAVPATANVISIKVHVEHHQEEDISSASVSWHAATGPLDSPVVTATTTAPDRFGESAETVDVWEVCVAGITCTADLVNNLIIVVENQVSQGKKAFLDRLWVEVTYN